MFPWMPTVATGKRSQSPCCSSSGLGSDTVRYKTLRWTAGFLFAVGPAGCVFLHKGWIPVASVIRFTIAPIVSSHTELDPEQGLIPPPLDRATYQGLSMAHAVKSAVLRNVMSASRAACVVVMLSSSFLGLRAVALDGFEGQLKIRCV